MVALKILRHITIYTFIFVFTVSLHAEKNEYPQDPDEVLKVALEQMHKRNYNVGAKYYHPDFFTRASKGIWNNIKDKKPDDIFMGDVTFKDLGGLNFEDGKLVEPTERQLFIISLIGFQRVMDKMGTDIYGEAEVLSSVLKDENTALVDYRVPKLIRHVAVDTVTQTATMVLLDGKWKIFSESQPKEEKAKK